MMADQLWPLYPRKMLFISKMASSREEYCAECYQISSTQQSIAKRRNPRNRSAQDQRMNIVRTFIGVDDF